jgi:putative ABC transport system permease protein
LNRETLLMAFRVVQRNPGRSFLTLLGLAIGVGAFIAMVSFGEGARRTVIAQFESLGTNLLQIRPVVRGGVLRKPLTNYDMTALERDSTTIGKVLPIARNSFGVSYEGKQMWTTVHGTTPDFAPMHSWELVLGGNFDAEDMSGRAKVCILGGTIVRELFGEIDPVGEQVTLGGRLACRVIGVLAEKGFSTSGRDTDDLVVIPVSTYAAYLGIPEGYNLLKLQPYKPELLAAAKFEATQILRRTHSIGPDQVDDFAIESPQEVIQAVDKTSAILAGLLQGIAAVSLLVGGVGIMNIQLVSVAERTAEIGIRSAIGASPGQIMMQFLVEGMLLSLLGALVGVVGGVGISVGVAWAMGWERVISGWGIVGSAFFGILVGLVFGFLPARRAAHLDPIEALRRQ